MIPEGWHSTTLNKVVDEKRKITYGIVQPGAFVPDGVLLIKAGDYSTGWVNPNDMYRVSDSINESYKRSQVQSGDILFTIVGSLGKTAMIPDWLEGANLTQQTARIAVDKKNYDNDFIYGWIQSDFVKKQVAKYRKDGVQPALNLADISKFNCVFPPLSEQTKIANIFKTWDEAIGKLELLITSKQKRKRALMQQLLTGKKRFKEFGTSSLEEKTLDEVARVVDSLHKTPTFAEDGFPMVRVTDIKGGFLNLENTVKVTKEVFEEFSKNHKPQQDDIVYSRVGSYGNASYVNNNEPFCLGQNTVVIVPNQDLVSGYFLYQLLQSSFIKKQIERNVDGSSHKTVSLKVIRALKVMLPSLTEQQRIAQVLKTADNEISNHQTQLESLKTQKRGLMQQLLTGKKRVKVEA